MLDIDLLIISYSYPYGKMLDLQHQYNNCTTTPHMRVGPVFKTLHNSCARVIFLSIQPSFKSTIEFVDLSSPIFFFLGKSTQTPSQTTTQLLICPSNYRLC
jgi:hypothetical protein